jgi:hypothetical protein
MKVLIATVLILVSVPAMAGTAFYKGERTTGMTKQCYYDYLGSTYTRTLQAYQVCPVTINV